MKEDEIKEEVIALKTDIYDRLENYDESDFDEIMYNFEELEYLGIDPFSFM